MQAEKVKSGLPQRILFNTHSMGTQSSQRILFNTPLTAVRTEHSFQYLLFNTRLTGALDGYTEVIHQSLLFSVSSVCSVRKRICTKHYSRDQQRTPSRTASQHTVFILFSLCSLCSLWLRFSDQRAQPLELAGGNARQCNSSLASFASLRHLAISDLICALN